MIIYPAIDLRGGKVVRLREGDPSRQTVFSDDPVKTAQNWIDQGAAWIHMVNLDGAFSAANDNECILETVAKSAVKLQFAGGMRSLADIERALNLGASRVVIGTAAAEHPEIVTEAVQQWGAEAICIALDARDGKVTTRGWQHATDLTPVELGLQMVERGAKHALYTDVTRDGLLTGANIEATIALGRETGLDVIASGGVSTIAEITELARSGAVAGAVIGMALYEGRLTLKAALEAAGGNHAR
jgi:phosphoribosylformimino-5-aminoimidazole carboxamide ribotide isomerase